MRSLAFLLMLACFAGSACAPAHADGNTVRTGKERLTDKASDEQRVNDCKVPPDRRTRPRPTACSDPQR